MYGKKVRLRILFIIAFTAIIVLSIYLVLKSVIMNLISLVVIEIESFLTIPPILIFFLSSSDDILISEGD